MDYSKTSKPTFNEHSASKEEEQFAQDREGDEDAEYYEPKLTPEMKGNGAEAVRRGIAAEEEYKKWLKYRVEPPQKIEKPMSQDFNNSVENQDMFDEALFKKMHAQQQARENKNTHTLRM